MAEQATGAAALGLPTHSMVARLAPREHANGAPGTWWAEYRVRLLTEPERGEVARRTQRAVPVWVLETRYCHEQDSEYCSHHSGEWETWDYGQTAREAALACAGDSQYVEAESLSPHHDAVKAQHARDKARSARIAELRAILYAEWRGRDGSIHHEAVDPVADEREQAQVRYEQELRRARLWKAASEGKASPEKVRVIAERVRAEYDERVKARVSEHEAARAELERLEREGRG